MDVVVKKTYRVSSVRLQSWDYGAEGAYFITICTKNKQHYFGKIIDGNIILSATGTIANKFWHDITNKFPYAVLESFVVMPNHIHGIIIIDRRRDGDLSRLSTNNDLTKTRRDGDLSRLKTNGDLLRTKTGGVTGIKNPMLNNNISTIIRWYKAKVTFESRKINPEFEWQSRFYEHIIRDNKGFDNISEYINTNHERWLKDSLYVIDKR